MKQAELRKQLLPFPFALFLAALACGPQASLTPGELARTTTPHSAEETPIATSPAATATFTPLTPTVTATAVPPTETPTLTSSPTLSPWLFVYGTWSGCTDDPQPNVPYQAHPCDDAWGDFVTLYLKPHCVIGEHCGNFVKGTFASEFILLKLTLIGIQGSVVWMHGEAPGMYSWATTDVTIERAGNDIRIEEQGGQEYIFNLPPGCDPIINSETSIGCYEHIP
ncbi:MAG: hypothetical protein JW929_05245 [Anaerolineales bacterium]|nr:hypothetical protein [Anaerolineales bacterium]